MQAIAVLPQGLEEEGAKELLSLGAKSVKPLKRSVAFEADMACFYRLHLQSRLAFRFLREIVRFKCDSPKSLYTSVQSALDWESWLHPSMSFKVDVSGSSDGLSHSHFTALQVKNALVDFQRSLWSKRSDIDLENPDLSLHLHLSQSEAVLSLNGSSNSLHRRGYRSAMGLAPLKENLAAGLIRLSQWEGNIPLVDPLCGSGTFLIEAVSIALKLSPGLNRSFLFEGWADFDQQLWEEEKNRAKRRICLNKKLPFIIGCEKDQDIARQATQNIAAAGLAKMIKIQNSHFSELILPNSKGLIVCNPPYGKRIGANEDLQSLYADLSNFIKRNASGWEFWLLNGNPKLSRCIGMKSSRRFRINNGGIDCRWLKYNVN